MAEFGMTVTPMTPEELEAFLARLDEEKVAKALKREIEEYNKRPESLEQQKLRFEKGIQYLAFFAAIAFNFICNYIGFWSDMKGAFPAAQWFAIEALMGFLVLTFAALYATKLAPLITFRRIYPKVLAMDLLAFLITGLFHMSIEYLL